MTSVHRQSAPALLSRGAAPVAIGGTGGSGTRVFARIVQTGGRFMGAELVRSWDALPLARFDWANALDLLTGADPDGLAGAFDAALAAHLAGHDPDLPWGWKHTHSYLVLPFLARRFPDLKFVHVLRDGRDIALGGNQNQVKHYGELAIGAGEESPVRSARFWSWANLRAAEDGARLLGDRYLAVRLEDLCADPATEVARLLEFTGCTDSAAVSAATELVAAPSSLGRWRGADAALAAELGEAAGTALRRFGYR